MTTDPPLSRLVLAATSVADDLGYVALSDLSNALESEGCDYRVIGGHMVTALVARWSLGAPIESVEPRLPDELEPSQHPVASRRRWHACASR
jgi:hypothetical protein